MIIGHELNENKLEDLRDNLAMRIIPVILQTTGQLKYAYGGCENILDNHCELAYKIADAMLRARSYNR